jgi:hypothetical protein
MSMAEAVMAILFQVLWSFALTPALSHWERVR